MSVDKGRGGEESVGGGEGGSTEKSEKKQFTILKATVFLHPDTVYCGSERGNAMVY